MATYTTYTLNQLKIMLTDWFNNHAMLNSVYYLNDFDFNSERQINYPTCNIKYINSSVDDIVMNHNYKIVIGDITTPNNNEMEDVIMSDSLQIAEDFITYLQELNGIYNLTIGTFEPFTEDTGDRICGVEFDITLGAARTSNKCDTPTKN